MSEARKKADWPIVAGLFAFVFAATLGLYVWGYFALGSPPHDSWDFGTGEVGIVRFYDAHWLTRLYYPCALVETVISGRPVDLEVAN